MYKEIFIDLIFNGETYNGHNTLTLDKSIPLDKAQKLCKAFQDILWDTEGWGGFVVCEYYTDGSGGIKAKYYWKEGEHPLGHIDKTLLSWEGE